MSFGDHTDVDRNDDDLDAEIQTASVKGAERPGFPRLLYEGRD